MREVPAEEFSMIGKVLKQYKNIVNLSKGGRGAVCLEHAERFGQYVAVNSKRR